MSLELQQALAQLQKAFDSGANKDEISKFITQLKVG
jgi:hypothetical protein